jgi:Pyruvate/2-oxoacid:ferredoxin oxidoreductase delta subunit
VGIGVRVVENEKKNKKMEKKVVNYERVKGCRVIGLG